MQYIRVMILAAWTSTLLLAGLTGCATDAPSDHVGDVEDTRSPADVDEKDTQGGQDALADAQPDTPDVPDAEPDPCEVCCPGDVTCINGGTRGVCKPDGSGYVEEECAAEQMCTGGACVARPVCTPGEKTCYDASTLQVCKADAGGWRTESCDPSTTCIDGSCVTGNRNGEACEQASDCAGGKCRCGAGESCPPYPAGAIEAYCTSGCTPGSCGPGELCLSASDFPAAGYDHCVPTCQQTCALPGMSCAWVATRDSGALSFQQACVPIGTVDIGKKCEADDVCTGGTCLEDYFEIGMCTSECTGDCPTGTACVKLVGDTFYCSPLCGDGSPGNSAPCPLAGSQQGMMSIGCATKTKYSGGAAHVCATTRSGG